MTRPALEGLRVADFGQFISGPAVGQLLSDLGATVVKVEPLAGEASRSAGVLGEAIVRANNRDKLGLAVDLRRSEGLEIARRLVRRSDVLIENMRPGAMERLGVGPDAATALNPRLVYLSITGYGRDAAPTRAGLDIAAQAESGIMSITGEQERDPQRVGFSVADQATAYAALGAVLAAMFRRERTGEGAVVDTSLLEVAIHLQGPTWVQMFETGVEPQRKGNGYPTAAPAAEVIDVRGGRIVLSAYTPAHWARLCSAIGRPDLIADPRFATNDARVAHRPQMRAELSAALASREVEEAVAFLADHGVVAGAVRSHRQVVDGPDAKRLSIFRRTAATTPPGYLYPAAPFRLGDGPPRPSSSAPRIGEHTRTVLAELGYTADEVDALVVSGVVRADE